MRACLLSWMLSLALAACGPSLRHDESFNPKRVNAIVFDDVCQLQGYFDARSSELRPQSETTAYAKAGEAIGRATFRLDAGRGGRALRRLLERHYRRLPPLQGELLVTVRFYDSDGARRMPIGAESQLEAGGKEVSLPYHPCLGYFFFGGAHYAMRRRLLSHSSL